MATFDINDQPRRVVNDGNGSTSSFPFSFQVNAASDIKVYVNAELRVAGTHYNIVNSSDAAGLNANGTGKVNFITTPTDYTPANGAKVSIVSDVPAARSSVYTSGGNITAASLETDFDTLTMLVGDREEAISRSVQGPVSDPTTTSMVLPSKDGRKNKYLAFDNDGSVTCLAGTSAPLNTVDTAQLVDDAVTTSKIADNAITTSKIADNAITNDLLATNAVQATNLAANSVTSSAIQNDSVDANKIAGNAVTQAAVASNAIGTDQIADGAVNSTKLASGIAFVAGMVMPFAGTSAPTGWLLAYGQAVSRSTYSSLFTAIGTTYGSGDGSSTFNLPDLRGRVAAGKDNMGGSAASRITSSQSNSDDPITGATLGDTGGDEVQDLQITHLPSHSHGAGTYAANLTILTTNAGDQTVARPANNDGQSTTTLNLSVSGNSGSTGSGTAVNNMQPTIILNYIIKI